jgi:hypothetical protein
MPGYPPGVSADTRNAPWNQPAAPECECCQEIIHDEGDHAEDCVNAGMNANELYIQREEDAEAAKAEAKMEEQRLQERSR